MSAKAPGSGALVGSWMGGNEVLALLAVGGTAEIYLARMGGEAGFEKYVVVKVLLDHLADDPDYVDMFLDEARLAAQLDHSNIVQTLELGQQDGRYYMVMEYLAGMSLAQLARLSQEKVPGGYMPIPVILGLAAQTCAGLHYAHHRIAADGTPLMVVHRDISPQNLVVSYKGVLKLVDFGIAKAALRSTHTQSGTIKGKFAYMSPEQCLAKQIDKRTDIFALGVICHELLTCRRLFKRGTTYETYQAIVAGEVPTPSSIRPELGPEIDELVLKALAYKKEDRYESASEFGEAILQLLHRRGQSVTASDVANYYEEFFAVELSEHAGRMRALIEHRAEETPVEDGWDSVDGLALEELEAVPAPRSVSAETAPIPTSAPNKPTLRADTQDHPAFDEDGEDEQSDATRVDDAAIEKVMAMHKRTAAIGAVNVPPKNTSGPDAATIMPSAGLQAKDVLAGLAAEKSASPAPAQIPAAKTAIETSGETVDDTLPPVMRDGAPPRPAGKKQNEVKRTMLGMRPVDKPGLAKPRPKPLPSLLDKNRPKGLARPPAGSSPAAEAGRAGTDAERGTTNSDLSDRPTQINMDTASKAETRHPDADRPSTAAPPGRKAAPTARTLYDSRPQTDRTAALMADGKAQPSSPPGQQPPLRADPTGPQPPFRPDSTGPRPPFQPDPTGPQPPFRPDSTGPQPRGRATSQPPAAPFPHSTPSSSGLPMPPPGLARRRSPYPTDHVSTKTPPPTWMIAVVFIVAAGIGLGVTLLVAALAG